MADDIEDENADKTEIQYVPVSIQQVEHGKSATAPQLEKHPGYDFIGWSTSYNNITSDTFVYAMYAQNKIDIDQLSPRCVKLINRSTTLYRYQ